MKHVPLLSALLLTAALMGAHRADAASAEQVLNISFTGIFQGPTTVANGIETKTSRTVAITTAQVIRAIAADIGDPNFTTWNGSTLRMSTDFDTRARTFLLRKGSNPPVDVTRFFTPAPGLGLLQFDQQLNDVRVTRNQDTFLPMLNPITLTGIQTLQISTTTLSFSLVGFANGGVIQAQKRQGTNVLSTPVILLRVPSQQPDPGPFATGTFTYNGVSGTAYNGVFTLGGPDTTH